MKNIKRIARCRLCRRSTIGLMLFIFILSGSTTGIIAGEPDWVNLHSKKYPERWYLLGVGRGDDDRSAEMNAYAAIARIFQVAVRQKQVEVSKYLTKQTEDDTQSQWESTFNEVTETSTRKTLKGVKIVETWVDSTKTVFKLAILDRRKNTRILDEKIEELDKTIRSHAKIIQQSGNNLEIARRYYSSIHLVMQRDALYNDYLIVSPTGKTKRFSTNLDTLSQELHDFLATNLNMTIELSGSNTEKIGTALAESLTKLGFTINQTGKESASGILIKGNISVYELDMPSRNKFVRWQSTFHMINQADGKEFGSLLRHGREAHISYEAAEQRAIHLMIKQLRKELVKDIFHFVFKNQQSI